MVQKMSFPRRLDRSGTSLIEVLVTFVVFLIGIVSVLRMFPGGFLSMRHTESVTLANRLAQTEIERWEGKTANLPSGILAWGQTGAGVLGALANEDPSNLEDPIAPGGYYFSDVNKFRRISSESTVIPVPSSTQWYNGSIYVLAFNPIAYDPADPNNSIVVYGSEMKSIPLPRDLNDLRFGSSSEYAIDHENAELYLKPFAGTDRYFTITYSYWEDAGAAGIRRIPIVGIRFPVPMLNDGSTYQVVQIPVDELVPPTPVSSVPGFNGIDEGSYSLHRKFDNMTGILGQGIWSPADPYQFKMLDPVSGVIAFNPLGYGYEEMTARGKEPLVAHIDYTVLDWHIIREERKLPDIFRSAADQEVKLTLRFIKKGGETVEQDGSIYAGLAPTVAFPITRDVLAIDVETGVVYDETSVIADPSSPTNGELVFQVNYKEGIIRFDPAFVDIHNNDQTAVSSFQGKTFRIYYRAEGDWALQAFKAYDVYRRSYTLPDPSTDPTQYLGYHQYYFDNNRIYFPKCYAGCTVAVDYSYRLSSDGPDAFVTGEAYQISEASRSDPYCWIDLLLNVQRVHGPTAQISRIAKVYGVSIGTRVIWHETGRRMQAGAWRKVNLQTYLTRVSG